MNKRRRWKAKAKRTDRRWMQMARSLGGGQMFGQVACAVRIPPHVLRASARRHVLKASEDRFVNGSGDGSPVSYLDAAREVEGEPALSPAYRAMEVLQRATSMAIPVEACIPPRLPCSCHECQGIHCMLPHPGHSHRDAIPPEWAIKKYSI